MLLFSLCNSLKKKEKKLSYNKNYVEKVVIHNSRAYKLVIQ